MQSFISKHYFKINFQRETFTLEIYFKILFLGIQMTRHKGRYVKLKDIHKIGST